MWKKLRVLSLLLALLATPLSAFADVFVSINLAPPLLPVYEQPLCPGDGYIWTPGYWAYGDFGYYWVPGTWVLAPYPGYLWTPGYWGWVGGFYSWHGGYWGPHVGFYGGVNYGFGYGGVGYQGGYWNHGRFVYNRSVNNVNINIVHNTYNAAVINRTAANRVSFNGGAGGIAAQPTAQERAFAGERHLQPTASQAQHQQAARADRSQLASANHGHPAVFATPRPGAFHAQGAVSRGTAAPFGGAAAHAAPRQAAPAYVQHAQAPQGPHTLITPRDAHPQAAAPHYQQPAQARTPQPHSQAPAAPRPQQHYQAPAAPRPQQHYQAPAAPRPQPHYQAPPVQHVQQPRPQPPAPHYQAPPPAQHPAAPQQHAQPQQQHRPGQH
jgi:hypothetical protein